MHLQRQRSVNHGLIGEFPGMPVDSPEASLVWTAEQNTAAFQDASANYAN